MQSGKLRSWMAAFQKRLLCRQNRIASRNSCDSFTGVITNGVCTSIMQTSCRPGMQVHCMVHKASRNNSSFPIAAYQVSGI
ncbi:uncharacterized protein LOC111445085 [Cucurbita moschata]|uniref:Uncharacterized protein LOC111445085 n=1 Tax=Cucurbita moschata TaxID=3662 RepID=A0A6J1FKN2_CUCMO|nr:uncharacterized protein LOC111445085 [Cucurbita moschata]